MEGDKWNSWTPISAPLANVNVARSNKNTIAEIYFKKVIFLYHAYNFDLNLPLKTQILKNFRIIVESSLIAHQHGNSILKNIKTGHFLIKLTCEEIGRRMYTCHKMGP